MRQLRDYLPSILLSGESSDFIDSFLSIYQKLVLRDDSDPITVFTPRATLLVRAAAPIAKLEEKAVVLSPQDPGPTPFRPGDKVRVTETATDVHRISTVSHISWSVLDSQYTLLLADDLPPAPFTPDFVRIADVESSDRRFRVETEHGISRGSRILVTQGATSADSTVIDVDGDFIHLNRGLVNTTGSFSQDLAAEPILVRVMHEPVEKTIDDLQQLFDPWKTRPDLLPWLASLLALEMEPHWGEYQRRFLVSKIASLYERLGVKEGLLTFLDIYAATTGKPRICLDDGESLFRLRMLDDNNARLELLAQAGTYSGTAANPPRMSLLHPTSIAVSKANEYIIADIGGAQSDSALLNPAAIWTLTSGGNVATEPVFDRSKLFWPSSIALDSQERVLVLDLGNITNPPRVYRLDGEVLHQLLPATGLPLPVSPLGLSYFVHPDDGGDCIAILARGSSSLPTQPTIHIYHDKSGVMERTVHDLYDGGNAFPSEPVCFVQRREYEFIVSDGTTLRSDPSDPEINQPANLYRVELKKDDDGLVAAPAAILPSDPSNPLIWPSGLIMDSPESLLLCDTGLRHLRPGQANRAELPAIYRVMIPTVGVALGVLSPIRTARRLTNPSAITKDRAGSILVLDQGDYLKKDVTVPGGLALEYRAVPHQACLVEHFSDKWPVPDDEQTRIRAGMRRIVEQYRPAHAMVHIKGIR